jgi:hypothetical protein
LFGSSRERGLNSININIAMVRNCPRKQKNGQGQAGYTVRVNVKKKMYHLLIRRGQLVTLRAIFIVFIWATGRTQSLLCHFKLN